MTQINSMKNEVLFFKRKVDVSVDNVHKLECALWHACNHTWVRCEEDVNDMSGATQRCAHCRLWRDPYMYACPISTTTDAA